MSPGLDGNQRGKYQQQEKKLLHNPKGKATFIYQVGNSFLLWCLFFCPFSCLQSHCWHMHTDLNTWIWRRGEMGAIISAAIPSSLQTDLFLSFTFTWWNRDGLGRDWMAPFHLLAMAKKGHMMSSCPHHPLCRHFGSSHFYCLLYISWSQVNTIATPPAKINCNISIARPAAQRLVAKKHLQNLSVQQGSGIS